ncbi:MAG: hypothetical protein WC804_14675 [Sphingomonas sp.]|uniref:hypothetical protein n=1 Tax=Sphingomonas sp. TaxID=28214 RepID=UPI003563519E
MGIVAVTCSLETRDLGISAEVGRSIEAFYAGVSVRVDHDRIILESSTCTEQRLRSIWRVALLNERLFAAGRSARAEVIGQLVA